MNRNRNVSQFKKKQKIPLRSHYRTLILVPFILLSIANCIGALSLLDHSLNLFAQLEQI